MSIGFLVIASVTVTLLSFSVAAYAIWDLTNDSEEDLLERTEDRRIEEGVDELEKEMSGEKLEEEIESLDFDDEK